MEDLSRQICLLKSSIRFGSSSALVALSHKLDHVKLKTSCLKLYIIQVKPKAGIPFLDFSDLARPWPHMLERKI